MAQPTATFLFLEPAPAGRAHALPMTSTRLLTVLTATLLVLAVVTGGDSQDRGWGDALTQLLAWPVLLLAVWRLASDTGGQVAGSRPAVGSYLLAFWQFRCREPAWGDRSALGLATVL